MAGMSKSNIEQFQTQDKLKRQYDRMNCCKRFIKLFTISEKEMYAVCGDIDTYIYMLFLRMASYLMLILMILNCCVLIPLYSLEGTTAETYIDPTNGMPDLTSIQQLSVANAINQQWITGLSLGFAVINVLLVFGMIFRVKRQIDIVLNKAEVQ
jgi:hypothetical protein